MGANCYTEEALTYDSNGNLTYDGLQAYTYDAWNRLRTVAHAYRDGSGVHSGRVVATMGYDAAGRRVTKAISGTGVDDCTYNYYLSGNSVVEERNGSDQRIKDHVWGLTYIDEAVQTRVNTNLSSPSWTGYWHLQDANFNELGVVNGSGSLVERYEYAAYGARSVYTSAGSNDPGCYAPAFGSRKVVIGGANQAWGINEIGHQGLLHDEESGLVYNRARHLNPALGRFMQVDPLSPADGLNPYEYVRSRPTLLLDPRGLCTCGPDVTQLLVDHLNEWVRSTPVNDFYPAVPSYKIPGYADTWLGGSPHRAERLAETARENGGRVRQVLGAMHYNCSRRPDPDVCEGTMTLGELCLSAQSFDHLLIMAYITITDREKDARLMGQLWEWRGGSLPDWGNIGLVWEGGSTFIDSPNPVGSADLWINELGIAIGRAMPVSTVWIDTGVDPFEPGITTGYNSIKYGQISVDAVRAMATRASWPAAKMGGKGRVGGGGPYSDCTPSSCEVPSFQMELPPLRGRR